MNINDIFINDLAQFKSLSFEEEQKIMKKVKIIEEKMKKINLTFFKTLLKNGQCKYDILTPAKKKRMHVLMDERKYHISTIINSNLKLIIKLALNYYELNYLTLKKKQIEFLDMVQNGIILIIQRAFTKYDMDSNNRFMSYAKNWLISSFRLEKKKIPHVKDLPIGFWERWKNITNAKEENPNITDNEIIKEIRIYPKTLNLFNNIPNVNNFNEDDADPISANSVFNPEKYQRKMEMIDEIQYALSLLTKKQRFVIEHRFALNGKKKYTLEKIGKLLKLTRERIRQIEDIALKKLKKKCPHLKNYLK